MVVGFNVLPIEEHEKICCSKDKIIRERERERERERKRERRGGWGKFQLVIMLRTHVCTKLSIKYCYGNGA